MRSGRFWCVAAAVPALLLAHAVPARAIPVTISDAYGQPNCGSGCDVIGANADFDAEKIVFTSLDSGNVTAKVYFNYHSGAQNLAPWTAFGLNLSVGDLIFSSGHADDVVPLHTHDAFQAGQLYPVSKLRTPEDVLGNLSGATYRKNEYVWGGGAQTALGSPGTVAVACANGESPVRGRCSSGGELIATATFDPDPTFWSDLSTAGLDVHFASATCGNDIIDGHLAPVPEPGTVLLLGTGLMGLGIVLRRRLGGS